MALRKPRSMFEWFSLCSLLLAAVVSSKHYHEGNPANDLVELINTNRTVQKLPNLITNPGLGCIALQYAEKCKENCTSNSNNNNTVNCHSSPDDFTEIFAPNCGVELPTFGTISGSILGCQQNYLTPSEAFSQVLSKDKKTFSILTNRTNNEVGIGIYGVHKHKGPYFWCVLFTSNSGMNNSFVLDDLGEGIKQQRGCYSGSNDPCSSGTTFDFNNLDRVLSLYLTLFLLYLLNYSYV